MFENITSQTNKFHMLNEKKNETIYFESFEEMLDFVAIGCHIHSFLTLDSYENIYLDYIDLTGHDYVFVKKYNLQTKDFVTSAEKCIYMFFDNKGNILDLRQNVTSIHKRYLEYCEKKRHLLAPKHEFRNGPVPGTSVKYRGRIVRHPKTLNEKKQNAIPEYKDYIRSKRKSKRLPDVYDDDFIRPEKSWKDKTKSRKAWAKHEKNALKRHYENFKKEYL